MLAPLVLTVGVGSSACGGDDPDPRTTVDGSTADASIRTDGGRDPDLGTTTDASSDATVGDATVDNDADVDATVDDADVDASGEDAEVDASVEDAGTDAGVDCRGAAEDGVCSAEGAFCGGPCTDVCSFCNILSCSGGRWRRLEVFPAPCFECGDKRCQQNEQLCRVAHSDVGGEPDVYACEPTPAACREDPSCECIADNGVASDRCTESDEGQITVEWFGG